MGTTNVVNPGLVNVADEADGETRVDQAVTVTPSSNAGPTVSVADGEPAGRGLPAEVRPS